MKDNSVLQKNVINFSYTKTPIEIALGIDENGMTTARKLYEFLELAKGQFSRWAKANILENEFAEEGVDYRGFDINVEGNLTQDFKLTASFAKKLSMTQKNEKGEQARNYFVTVENKTKELISTIKGLSPELQAVIVVDKRVTRVEESVSKINSELQEFKNDIPLFNVECEELTKEKNRKVVPLLGGKKAPAYQNRSLRGKVYSDINQQLIREFGIHSYKAIKRSQQETALSIIREYHLPLILKEEIEKVNSQAENEGDKI